MQHYRRDMTRIVQSGKRYVAKIVKHPDLSPNEVQALRYIVFHEGLSQSNLCAHTGLDKAAVTRLAVELEQKKYIRRELDPEDRRIKRLVPLPSATEIATRAVEAEEQFYDWLLEELTDTEKLFVERILDNLYARAMEARRNGFSEIPKK